MSPISRHPRVQELKPEHLRALDSAFGNAELPPVCAVHGTWEETKASIREMFPAQGQQSAKSNLPDQRSRDFADMYFNAGHTLEECSRLLGEKVPGLRALNIKVLHRVADSFAITAPEAGAMLLQYRVDKICGRWRPWYDKLQQWTAGGTAPQTLTVDFHRNFFEATAIFERLNFQWRNLVRQSAGPVELVPTRIFERKETKAFLLDVREGEVTHNSYLVADAAGKFFTPRSSNWRAVIGPAGHFSRLLLGDGPVCLRTAFAPRPVRVYYPEGRAEKSVHLFSEGKSSSGLLAHIPAPYIGRFVRPAVPLDEVRAGVSCEYFNLNAFHPVPNAEPIARPIGKYRVECAGGLIERVAVHQYLDVFASWRNPSGRQLDSLGVKRWLAGETQEIPRLEPLRVRTGKIYENGTDTGRTRKFVFLCKQKLAIPKSYEGSEVIPALITLEGTRLLELHAYPRAQQEVRLKVFKLVDDRLITSSELGT